MTQFEWNDQFRDKYPSQPGVQDYMNNELDAIEAALENYNFDFTDSQMMVLWEAWSASHDGSWLGAKPDTIARTIHDFVRDPADWWRRHPYTKSYYGSIL